MLERRIGRVDVAQTESRWQENRLKIAISGKGGGPELDGIMELLGQKETINRLNNFATFCTKELEAV